jgi:mannose-1-phosphate guanylyltransferase
MISAEAKVGGGSVIGARARVESGAQVSGSVLGDDCVIQSGAVVVDSVVGIGARVDSGAVLREVVVGDRAVVGPGNELLAGSRIWPGIVLPECAIRFSSDA